MNSVCTDTVAVPSIGTPRGVAATAGESRRLPGAAWAYLFFRVSELTKIIDEGISEAISGIRIDEGISDFRISKLTIRQLFLTKLTLVLVVQLQML